MALFYTEDCPKRGWFGRGLNCRYARARAHACTYARACAFTNERTHARACTRAPITPCLVGGHCPGSSLVWQQFHVKIIVHMSMFSAAQTLFGRGVLPRRRQNMVLQMHGCMQAHAHMHACTNTRPLPGYWSPPGGFAGWVAPCHPPHLSSRCIGGQFSLCDQKYQGQFCDTCAFDHYKRGRECVKCQPGQQGRRCMPIGLLSLKAINTGCAHNEVNDHCCKMSQALDGSAIFDDRYMMITVFVLSFNLLLFFAHLDVIIIALVVVETLQTSPVLLLNC